MANTIVVIPHYKDKEKLAKCQAALGNGVPVIVQEDEKGEGFTPNVNRGLKKALESSHEYILVLNQDCYVTPATVGALEVFMALNPKAGIAGCKQLLTTNEDQIVHGGTKDCFPAGVHEGGLVSRGDCAKTKKVPWVNGAIMMIRKSCLVEVGLLDPTMVMFASDADISYRARAFGWECWYVAEAECLHDVGVSQTRDDKTNKRFTLDMLAFRDKWIGTELYRNLTMERL